MNPKPTDLVLSFNTGTDWEEWLASNHSGSGGIWLRFAKKGSGLRTVTYSDAVEVALCYGWIDGQLKSLGKTHFLQRFTPRRSKSLWSQRNIQKVEKLIADCRMKPAGMAQVEAAKADGRWTQAYDSPSTSQVPPDFAKALKQHPRAGKFFASLNRTNVYAFLYRIQTAKKPGTRAARIEKFIAMLEAGQTLHLMPSRKPAAAPGSAKTKPKRHTR